MTEHTVSSALHSAFGQQQNPLSHPHQCQEHHLGTVPPCPLELRKVRLCLTPLCLPREGSLHPPRSAPSLDHSSVHCHLVRGTPQEGLGPDLPLHQPAYRGFGHLLPPVDEGAQAHQQGLHPLIPRAQSKEKLAGTRILERYRGQTGWGQQGAGGVPKWHVGDQPANSTASLPCIPVTLLSSPCPWRSWSPRKHTQRARSHVASLPEKPGTCCHLHPLF